MLAPGRGHGGAFIRSEKRVKDHQQRCVLLFGNPLAFDVDSLVLPSYLQCYIADILVAAASPPYPPLRSGSVSWCYSFKRQVRRLL